MAWAVLHHYITAHEHSIKATHIAGRPKAALQFLVILDVARCYLWLFLLNINIKIGKNSCSMLD